MTGAGKDTLVKGKRSCTVLFFSAYFIYYAVYCVFSSFIVLFLTEQGYSATVCGIITSLTFLANLLMEPVGGYITDTFLPTRRYLLVCIGIVSMVCAFCTKFMDQSWLLLPGLVLAAGLAYPFSQLMDAWVNLSKESYPGLIYSRIRAGGSIGFAVMSVIGGFYFKHWGWNRYFQMQILLFLMMIPFLILLPDTRLGNHRKKGEAEKSLSFVQAFQQLVKSRRFCFCLTISTLYWFSHRPVGSFLSLLLRSVEEMRIIWKCLWNRSSRRVFESAFVSLYWKKENLSGPLGDGSSFGHKPASSDLFSALWGRVVSLYGTDSSISQFCPLYERQRRVFCGNIR